MRKGEWAYMSNVHNPCRLMSIGDAQSYFGVMMAWMMIHDDHDDCRNWWSLMVFHGDYVGYGDYDFILMMRDD